MNDADGRALVKTETAPGRSPRAIRDGFVIAAFAVVAAVAHFSGFSSGLSRALTDLRFTWSDRQPSDRIVMVDIDARSLADVGVWPWDRRIYADLIRAAAAGGAEAIAFDIDFSAHSNPESDVAIADAIDETGLPVFMASFVQAHSAATSEWHLSTPVEPIASRTWPALVNVPVDPDGKVRATLYGIETPEGPIASMPALIAGDPAVEGAFAIDYGVDAAALARISFIDVVKGRAPPGLLEGRTLLVGATAVELRDLFPVPRHGIMSGSTILALATETLIAGRASALPGFALPLLAAASVAGAIAFAFLRSGLVVLPLLATAAALEATAIRSYLLDGHRIDTGPALMVLAAAVLWGFLREIDVTRWLLRLAKIQVANADRLLFRVIEDGFDGIVVSDADGRILHINQAARSVLRLEDTPTDIRQIPDGIVRPGSAGGTVDPDGHHETTTIAIAGDERVLELARRPVRMDASDTGETATELQCVSFRDVTERHRAAEALAYMAFHDALTGRLNRQGLERHLAEEAARRPGLLVFFDLDRFKDINVKLGHAVGDLLLKEVAARAQCALGPEAHLARLGGDGFAAIAQPAPGAGSIAPAFPLLRELSRPFRIQNHTITIAATAGLRAWEAGETTASELMRQADLALGEAKRTARGAAVLFSNELESARLDNLRLQQDLIPALERNEFVTVYQPQVSLFTGRIVGAEALTRWFHPERGPVSPGVFVPILEETGLIHRLGERTLANACRDASGWPEDVRIAVNVSPLELEMGDVANVVADVLSSTGLKPERLDLEITETAFARETPRIGEQLRRIRGFGVGFALDDFGTGYSSLGYVHRFPIGKIKIDMSFVRGLPEDETAEAIVRSVVALAGSLSLKTVAEGIETRAQEEVLRRIGCTEGQGYYYSRPVDAATFRALLDADAEAARLRVG